MPSPREMFKLAYDASHLKNFEEAEKYYRQALALNPKYSMAWNNLGWILYDQQQQYKEAENCYRKALKWNKNNFFAWNNLGILHYRQKKKYKKAQNCWEKAVAINPEFGMAWNNLSVLNKFQLKKPAKARECAEKATIYSGRDSKKSRSSTRSTNCCVECGSTLELHQKICDICGLER